jgi:hypothetical protein
MTTHYVDRLSRTDRDVILTLVPEGAWCWIWGAVIAACSIRNGGSSSTFAEPGVDIDGQRLVNGLAHGSMCTMGDLDAGLPIFRMAPTISSS